MGGSVRIRAEVQRNLYLRQRSNCPYCLLNIEEKILKHKTMSEKKKKKGMNEGQNKKLFHE